MLRKLKIIKELQKSPIYSFGSNLQSSTVLHLQVWTLDSVASSLLCSCATVQFYLAFVVAHNLECISEF